MRRRPAACGGSRYEPVQEPQLGEAGEVLDRLGRGSRSYLSERIQPTWLHQNPSWSGEWTSAGWSDSRWWCRWCAAHQSTPFWAEVSAKKREQELEDPRRLERRGARSSGGTPPSPPTSARNRAPPPTPRRTSGRGRRRRPPGRRGGTRRTGWSSTQLMRRSRLVTRRSTSSPLATSARTRMLTLCQGPVRTPQISRASAATPGTPARLPGRRGPGRWRRLLGRSSRARARRTRSVIARRMSPARA